MRIISAKHVDGRLCLATCSNGVLVFDPKSESWRAYGPEQGLPSSKVWQALAIGARSLLCNSGDASYVLNLADGSVRRLEAAPRGVLLPWWDGDRLMAVDDNGLWSDLLATSPRHTPIAAAAYDGWNADPDRWAFGGAAESDGRRFCTTFAGLHELDAARARVARSWWGLYYTVRTQPVRWSVIAPPTCPLAYPARRLFASGSRLVVHNGFSLTVYDLKADTWYGPLRFRSIGEMLVMPDGAMWAPTESSDGLAYLTVDDVVLQAKAVGRGMTTAEFHRRVQQFIDGAPPLDRGKLALAGRQFDNARSAFLKVLDVEPNQPEALLLMGFLHGRSCLNQPDEAIRYYRRAAGLAGNPSAAYTGAYLWADLLEDCRRWKEAVELCDKILQRFPELENHNRQSVQSIRDYSRLQLTLTKHDSENRSP